MATIKKKKYFKLDSSLALFNKQTFKNQNFTNYGKKKIQKSLGMNIEITSKLQKI